MTTKINLIATKEFAVIKGLERERVEELCQKVANLLEITVKKNRIEFIEEVGSREQMSTPTSHLIVRGIITSLLVKKTKEKKTLKCWTSLCYSTKIKFPLLFVKYRHQKIINTKKLHMKSSKEKNLDTIKNENIEKTKNLLESNKEKITKIINQKTNELTPLHLTVANNNIEITKLLLENGARSDSEDSLGNNCFHYSAKRAIIGWLLEQGADYNYKVNNWLFKNFSVEDELSQKDYSYAKNYQRILEEFKKIENDFSERISLLDFSFQDLVEGKEEAISKLSENAKKERENFLEIQEEIAKNPSYSFLKKQLELAKERLTKEIERIKKEEVQKYDLTTKLEVSPWNYFKH
ncbi:13967_t:CDS:2 [Entrophospora sp. SA101]|nr:13967_t:CDS:2 [Entrophospora sp. SA101]